MSMTGSQFLCIVTVDAEEEWDWKNGFPEPPFSTGNIECIPEFQRLCVEYDVCPTYFIDHAVASNSEHVRMFKKLFCAGQCDIGAQLHCWSNPPYTEERSEINSHAVNLSENVVRAKLTELTGLLQESFDVHPFSFRCGRWGMNGSILKILRDLGYSLDASIRPFYEDLQFSYNCAPTRPYFPSFCDITQCGSQREILEIPVTEGFNRRPFSLINRIHRNFTNEPYSRLHINGLLWKLGLIRKISLTPEDNNANDLCRCIDMHIKNGSTILQLFFHSSDLLPGCTPYVKSKTDLEKFYATLDQCFDHLRSVYTVKFLGVREAHSVLLGQIDTRKTID